MTVSCMFCVFLLLFFFCRTCFSMGDLGVHVSVRLSVHSSVHPSVNIYHRCLVNATPLSFLPIFLKLCRCFLHGMRMRTWFGYNCYIIFCHFFHFVNLSHFSTSMYKQWVPCERDSSYNFRPIFLKLCTCFLHGLKICMWFGCNPCLNFCHFFHFVNFVIF